MTQRPPWAGRATSIGSLPHTDTRKAIDTVLDATPELPAAPQLPRRSPREGMIPQAVDGVPGTMTDAGGKLSVDVRRLDPEADLPVSFATPAWAGLRGFVDRVAKRPGPLKFQLTGPATLALALIAAGTPPGLAVSVGRRAAVARIRALREYLDARLEKAAISVFLDEPGLVKVLRPELHLDDDELTALLRESVEAFGKTIVTGMHCCGDTEWKPLYASGISIASMNARQAMTLGAKETTAFLEGGGSIAWGAVPSDGPLVDDDDLLWRELTAAWHDLGRRGVDVDLLQHHALVTPVCGLVGIGPRHARNALKMSARLAERLPHHTADLETGGAGNVQS